MPKTNRLVLRTVVKFVFCPQQSSTNGLRKLSHVIKRTSRLLPLTELGIDRILVLVTFKFCGTFFQKGHNTFFEIMGITAFALQFCLECQLFIKRIFKRPSDSSL